MNALQRLPRLLRPPVIGPLALAAVLVAPAPASAQPSLSASIGRALDAYAQTTATDESRGRTTGSVEAEHVFAGERARLFYTFDAGDYTTAGDWSYFQNNAGVSYRFGGSDLAAPRVFVNASATWRNNGASWSDANYAAFGGGINVELQPRTGLTTRFGYRADRRSFPDMGALDQTEHKAFGSVLVNLATRTTLIAEAQVGGKWYDGVTLTQWIEQTAPATPGVSRGMGQGAGMGPAMRGGAYATTSLEGAGSAGQMTVLGRVAQSLTDRLGLHAQVSARTTFGRVPPAVVTTPPSFFEDGVYDDPYASDAFAWQAGFKQVFTHGGSVQASASRWAKHFNSVVAVAADGAPLAGDPIRRDRVWLGSADWIVPLLASKTGAVGLSLDVGYRFTRQRSNDAFYNYTVHGVGIGFTVEY